MVSLAAARAATAAFSPSYLPVAVFVGGTSGIGRGTAQAFARATKGNAHVVIVGRNQAAADELIASFPKPTAPEAKHEFVYSNVVLMRNVQETAERLRARLAKINFLVLSPGMNFYFRADKTEEGIDKRLALNYYARWKFVHDLLPLLRAARDAGEDAKILSVLAVGHGGAMDLDNLGMKKSYTPMRVQQAMPTYTDLMFEHYAKENPGIAFVHTFPGFVYTGLVEQKHWALRPLNMLTRRLAASPEDCGEYMLYNLLHSDKGLCRRNERGEDIGRTNWFGTEEEGERLWEHTKEEIDHALNVTLPTA